MGGGHISIFACFENTDLKITKEGRSRLYKVWELQQAGRPDRDGLHIDLPENFTLFAQNSNDILTLSIVIRNVNGKIVHQDQVGQYGVIRVRR